MFILNLVRIRCVPAYIVKWWVSEPNGSLVTGCMYDTYGNNNNNISIKSIEEQEEEYKMIPHELAGGMMMLSC